MDRRIRRDRYMDMLYRGRGLRDVVKVVTGMRRAGKSTLLDMYCDELIRDGVDEADIVRINFETFEYRDVEDRKALDRILVDRIGDSGERYVFLDEVQNVDGWEKSVSSLINTGRCDVYITGSNSKMLSSDLVTHIAGRFIEVSVLPLSFAEYLELHPGDRDSRFNSYLRYGSLPEVDPDRGGTFCDAQLMGIFNTVLVEDILEVEENTPVGAIKIEILEEDDVLVFAEYQYAIEDALCLWSDVPELLEGALRAYQGRAFWDGLGDMDPEFLDKMSRKYGLVIL